MGLNANAISPLCGCQFYSSELMIDRLQIQARKHRQKRINKKWLKRYGHKIIEIPSKKYYIMGTNVIAHPSMIDKLKELINK